MQEDVFVISGALSYHWSNLLQEIPATSSFAAQRNTKKKPGFKALAYSDLCLEIALELCTAAGIPPQQVFYQVAIFSTRAGLYTDQSLSSSFQIQCVYTSIYIHMCVYIYI